MRRRAAFRPERSACPCRWPRGWNKERTEDRRLWRTGAIAPLRVAALVLMGQAPPGNVAKLVEAERSVLRESSGRVRAVLHTQADGSPPLDFRDGAGNPRARLGLSGDVAAFSLTDAKGKGGRHAWSSTPSRTGRWASPSTIRTDGSARSWTWSPMVPPREPSSTRAGRAGRSWDTPSWKGGSPERGSGARSLGMEVRELTRRTAGLSPRALAVGPDRSVILPSS